MTPWFLRPFSQGAPDEDDTPTPAAVAPPSPPPQAAPDPLPQPEPSRAAWHPPRISEPAPLPPAEHDARPEEPSAEIETAEERGQDERTGERGRGRRRRGSRGRGRAAGNGRSEEAHTGPELDDEPFEDASASTLPAPIPMPSHRRPARRFEDEYSSPAPVPQPREVVYTVAPERMSSGDERKIALFCDLENIALGVRDSAEVKKFDINLVLERLLEKGKIIVKKAYCDWERYSEFKRPFHEAAIELIDIPQKYYSGKNSADIKMVVDAMDLCYSKEHLDTFVLLSGDSDFSPLVSKLKENNKYVIGVGVKGASSNLLIANCDEFIYYEDVWREQQRAPQIDGLPKKQSEVFALMVDAMEALLRENKDVLWGSMIKQTMQRKKPSFNEGYYGYNTFSELLEDAEEKGLIRLKKDQRSGSYIVMGFADRR